MPLMSHRELLDAAEPIAEYLDAPVDQILRSLMQLGVEALAAGSVIESENRVYPPEPRSETDETCEPISRMGRSDWRAHAAVQKAIRAGAVPPIRLRACEDCGGRALYYHHDQGYAEEFWLSVVPVCARCHGARHSPARVEESVSDSPVS